VALLVASLPVIGGRMIAKWRHILSRNTNVQSLILSRSLRSGRQSTNNKSMSTVELDQAKFVNGAFVNGKEKSIETVVSTGSFTIAEESDENEPASLLYHMARMGRQNSRDRGHEEGNRVTIKKEVYIREEQVDRTNEPGSDDNV
jgi:hypothetical protein